MGQKKDDVGIYLHWSGGKASVRAFLDAAKELGVRTGDKEYGTARLTQIIGNFMGGTHSLGIGSLKNLDCDNGDNGLYVIDDQFNIVKRVYAPDEEDDREEQYRGVLKDTLNANRKFFEQKGI
jgi:hypothetical protein